LDFFWVGGGGYGNGNGNGNDKKVNGILRNGTTTARAKALLVSGLPRADNAALAMTTTATEKRQRQNWKTATAF
jgi:hypothetical protein